MKARKYFTENVTSFLNKIKTIWKDDKIIFCHNAGENKNLKYNRAKIFEEINFKFMLPGTPK